MKKLYQITRNEIGSSLPMVIVAAAVLAIISLGALSLTSSILEAGAKARFDSEIANELLEMRTLLGDEAICTANLKGRVLSNNYSDEFLLQNYDSSSSSLMDSPLVNSEILQGYKLRMKTNSTAALTARFKARSAVLGQQEVFRDVSVAIVKDEGNAVVRCSTSPLPGGGLAPALNEAKIRCLSQGGGLNNELAQPQAQCRNIAAHACDLASDASNVCVQDKLSVIAPGFSYIPGASFATCLWTCKIQE